MNFDDEINKIITTDNESVNKVLRNYASSLFEQKSNPIIRWGTNNTTGGDLIYDSMIAYNILRNSQKRMLDDNVTPNRDNYYHREGMCRAAQHSVAGAALIGGIIKEGIDMVNKSKTIGWKEALKDSTKDMMNNLDGLRLGMENPDVPCSELLKGFDSKNNRWK